MDYVYFVKNDERNEELRYSLRSLKNADVDTVWIVGYTPTWVKNVNSVRGNRYTQKEWAVRDNVQIIADHSSMPDEVVVMNDDFFLMRRYTPTVEYRGSLREQFAGLSNPGTWWGRSLGTTYDHLRHTGIEDPVSYELHKPIPINRHQMGEALATIVHVSPIPQWRTIYGNHVQPDAKQGKDCKIRRPQDEFDKRSPLLSTEDAAFAKGAVGDFIRSKFTEPSPYERGE